MFFAIRPDAAACARIAEVSDRLARRFARTARAVTQARWHISLMFVTGGCEPPPEARLAAIRTAADKVAMAPFTLAFDRVVSWKGRDGHRPLVLAGDEGLIGAEILNHQIHRALALGGLCVGRERAFIPHLTLLWGDHDLAEQAMAPIRWTVREFALLHSLPGGQQALGSWRLA